MNKTFEEHCWKDSMDDEIREVYKSYNRETYVGRNSALLAIDLYNLVSEGGPTPWRRW
jgi:maleamate amidohydrolase